MGNIKNNYKKMTLKNRKKGMACDYPIKTKTEKGIKMLECLKKFLEKSQRNVGISNPLSIN